MSDEQQPAKRGRGRPPKIIVTPREAPRSLDDLAADINARRMRGERIATKDIPLREPGRWALREGNTEVSENRHYELGHLKGWVPLTPADLEPGITPEAIGYRVTKDGRLVRGPRDSAVLYKKGKAIHDAIKLKEAEDNLKPQRSESVAKAQAATAVAGVFGSEAAEAVARSGSITIKDHQGPL